MLQHVSESIPDIHTFHRLLDTSIVDIVDQDLIIPDTTMAYFEIDELVTNRDLYQCTRCRRQTSPIAGTIFAATHLSLRLWFRSIYHLTQTSRASPASSWAVASG